MGLVARALLAFAALPGVVGFLAPWLIAGATRPASFSPLGLAPLVPGFVLLLWCVHAFYRRGSGTLAPWDPPRVLVAQGIYGVSRNPMYVAVVLILWGWAFGLASWPLAVYAAAVMVAFHLRVVFGEEPWLSRRYGDEWARYAARVPRWLGRVRHAPRLPAVDDAGRTDETSGSR
jgi:protein-S-isoprenylcysteine O-methyltransferase Ste14